MRGVGRAAAPRLGARGAGPRGQTRAPAGRAASGLPWGGAGRGRCGARGPGPPPEVEPYPASGARPALRRPGPRGLRAPPAPGSPRGPGPVPQCPRPVTRGGRGSPVATVGPAPTRIGRGSAVGGARRPARPAPDACCGAVLLLAVLAAATCDGVTREISVDVSWHSAHHWPACGRPSSGQGLRPCHPQDAPTQDPASGRVLLPRVVRPRGRGRGTWLHCFLPPALLLPQTEVGACCKLLTRPRGIASPCPHLTETLPGLPVDP